MRSQAIRRLKKDESGMAMGLAILTMVLIGVMGAGLLTFVVTDLNSVVEVNQGQRAFEMADAGVQAAKQQLAEDSVPDHYDTLDTGANDIQWSADSTKGGVTLKDLDGDGDPTDSVLVRIESLPTPVGSFKVIATGQYRNAKRKVEAVFQPSTGTSSSGIPAYYTPGSIQLKKEASIDVSMFAGGNIRFGKNSLVGSTAEDPLGDWNRAPYNTTPRKNTGAPYTKTGLAAEGYICQSTGGCSGQNDSIADGIIGYDKSTGADVRSVGNKKKFVEKIPPTLQPQDSGTITYPYSRVPNVAGLLERAKSSPPNVYDSSPPFDNIPNSTALRVHFIDAGGDNVSLNRTFTFRGVLVIRCGNLNLDMQPTIEGIVMMIKGDGDGCADTGKISIKKGANIDGYVYAGSESSDAMDIDKDATLSPPPIGVYDEYLKLSYLSTLNLVSWRELYQ